MNSGTMKTITDRAQKVMNDGTPKTSLAQQKLDKLQAEYSELLADYSHLKNSENVLVDGQIRFVFGHEDLGDDTAVELMKTIAKMIQSKGVAYTITIADNGALMKTTGTPS